MYPILVSAPPAEQVQLMIIGPLIQEADTTPTQNAPLLIENDQLTQWIALVFMALFLDITALPWAVLHGLVL